MLSAYTPGTPGLPSLREWEKKRVQVDPNIMGGEPVFAGTRLTVRHIGGMLLRGGSADEILEDYPYLSDEDLDFACKFTQESHSGCTRFT